MKTTDTKITIIIEKTDTGFSGYAEKHPIFTTGNSVQELMTNALEAANGFFEEQDIQLQRHNLRFEIDLQQFFQYYKLINSKVLANKIGMNPSLLSQYVHGRKKPSEKQKEKILNGIHEIGQELADINLVCK